jgi:hypothetical protein
MEPNIVPTMRSPSSPGVHIEVTSDSHLRILRRRPVDTEETMMTAIWSPLGLLRR